MDKDTDYDCHYTIKLYHSEKVETEEGWCHKKIELQPLNPEYEIIKLGTESECKMRNPPYTRSNSGGSSRLQ